MPAPPPLLGQAPPPVTLTQRPDDGLMEVDGCILLQTSTFAIEDTRATCKRNIHRLLIPPFSIFKTQLSVSPILTVFLPFSRFVTQLSD